MNAERRRSLSTVFVMDEEHLQQLDDILLQVEKPRSYEITFVDYSSAQCGSIEEVIRQAGRSKLAIREIDGTTPIGEKPTVRIIIGRATERYTIYYSITGNETEVPYLDMRLSQWVNDIKPWYAWLSRLDVLTTLSMSLFVASLLLILFFGCIDVWLISRGIPIPISAPKPIDPPVALGVAGVILVALLAISAVVGLLRALLFPPVLFALGGGLRRYRRVMGAQRILGVILAVVFTLLCGIFVNWIAHG